MIPMKQTLYYRDEKSDKVYTVEVREAKGNRFDVWALYGRRGSAMQTDCKTKAGPVPLEEAQKLFEQLVREKTAKGYAPGKDGPSYRPPEPQAEPAMARDGVFQRNGLPSSQLLNPISKEEANELLHDPAWLLQPKFDGVRVRVEKLGGVVRGISRTNKPVSLPEDLIDSLPRHPRDLVLDGELVSDSYIAFDVLLDGEEQIWKRRAEDRLGYLTHLLMQGEGRFTPILPVISAFSQADKHQLYERIHTMGMEGVVFKRKDAPYSAGRPNTGGPALKLKFLNECSVIVAGQHGTKSSVDMKLYDGTHVGSVTIPPNKKMPKAGQVIDVCYLYRHDVGGDLIQAVYLGPREDIEPQECTAAQLRVKGAERSAKK